MKLPTALVVAGLVLLGISLWLINSHRWVPLTMPVSLGPGRIRSQPFTVDLAAEYSVEMEVDHFLPFEQLEAILGVTLFADKQRTRPVFDLAFTVEDVAGKLVKQTAVAGFGSSGRGVVRILGEFSAIKGHTYRLHVVVADDGSVLNPGNPRLVVRENSHIYKGNLVTAQLLALPACGLIGVGALWLLLVFTSRLVRKADARALPP